MFLHAITKNLFLLVCINESFFANIVSECKITYLI